MKSYRPNAFGPKANLNPSDDFVTTYVTLCMLKSGGWFKIIANFKHLRQYNLKVKQAGTISKNIIIMQRNVFIS